MDVVYFELNNWECGKYYPEEEPFLTWMDDDLKLYFEDESFVMDNNLCVVVSLVDMSVNFCITAPKEFVDKNCPNLLTNEELSKFVREPDEDGIVEGMFGSKFLEWSEENVGVHYENEEQ